MVPETMLATQTRPMPACDLFDERLGKFLLPASVAVAPRDAYGRILIASPATLPT